MKVRNSVLILEQTLNTLLISGRPEYEKEIKELKYLIAEFSRPDIGLVESKILTRRTGCLFLNIDKVTIEISQQDRKESFITRAYQFVMGLLLLGVINN